MSAPARGPEPLRLCLAGPSLPSQLSAARRRMATWADGLGVAPETVDDLVLATHEALANVADHAYADSDSDSGEAMVDAEVSIAGELVVVVRDRGRWRPPAAAPGWRGRGLLIIRGLADAVEVHHDDSGTTVEMRWRLPASPDGASRDAPHWNERRDG
jgi:serine/threonine-protein kinase RsbW